jgi:hypothetical protein
MNLKMLQVTLSMHLNKFINTSDKFFKVLNKNLSE